MKTPSIIHVVVLLCWASLLPAQERQTFTAASVTSPACECSFLIRIDRDLIEPPPQRVQSRDPVDRMILGTRAVGTSNTVGTMRVAVDDRSTEPALYIMFDGHTHTWTNGKNGPANIRCRTATTSRCSRKIVFTLDRGFVAYPSQISTATNLLVDDIGTDVPGFRGRLVQRIARRRSEESHSQARAIVDQQTKVDIQREFESAVDQYLVGLNQEFKTVRQLATLSGKNARLQMKLTGEDGKTVVLYMAEEGANVVLPKFDEAQAKAEVWIKKPELPSIPSVPSAVTALFTRQMPSVAGVLAVTPLMKLPELGEGEKMGYRSHGDWTIIGLDSTRSPIAHRPAQPASRRLASVRE